LDIGTISLLIVVVMIALMLTGMPLAWVTMLLAVGCTLFWLGPAGLPLVASRVYGFVSEYVFVAVPLFVLMACILEGSGVARDLYRAMHVFAGGLPGGLAVQTTLVAVVMAAMTGIIGGEIVLLGLIALPQMLDRGYDPKLAIGTICAGGSLGTMIPPSVVLILYGLTAMSRSAICSWRASRRACCWAVSMSATSCCAAASTPRSGRRPRSPTARCRWPRSWPCSRG
jgi:TRAP-type mannitol/chloroaromatic compound transport system permease large subunit